ncbi:retrotransposon gag protein [Holotrichia oblita]|uniref:Retrotransposon gag protein n=1 Tax=Holotrichia oblita TaxID=644536 RepID=A0ACB9T390_HOLOL|nr:retrotransposon gag protein [Holotrichia oblita]
MNTSAVALLGGLTGVTSSSDSDEPDADQGLVGNNLVLQGSNTKSVPVMRWGLKYSCDNSELSFNAFIERVEELMSARSMSGEQVFAQALDLFSGYALIWFRAHRKSISCWDELVVALSEEFQPADYDEQLFDEIRKRSQGSHESIEMYVSTITNLFSRLSIKIPENNCVKIMVRNLSPFYQSQLGLAEVRSVDELLSIRRKLEWWKTCADRYVPPLRKQHTLEPDLAYMSSSSSVASVESASRLTPKC